jgi:vacuolar-type H+-ATPase subunit F/Vma7
VNAVVLGGADDARGFALCGWPTRACRDASELTAALAALRGRRDLALVLLSAPAAALAPRAVEAFRAAAARTVVLVLP